MMYCSILIKFQVLRAKMKGIFHPVWAEQLMEPKCQPCLMSLSLQDGGEQDISDPTVCVVTHTLPIGLVGKKV